MKEIFNNIDVLNLEMFNFNGEKLNLKNIFLKIDLYESIFEYFLTGKIVIADTQDLIANYPIIGNETLKLSLQYEDKIVDLEFGVYKIEKDISNLKGIQKNKIFILYFCSKEKLITTKFSKKYSGKAETIINNLITTNLSSSKAFSSIASANSIDVHSNFWDFKHIIDYIVKITKSSKYYDYLFYETLDGLNFSPVSYLLSQTKTEYLGFGLNDYSFYKNDNIRVIKFQNYFNIIEDQYFGMFGKTLYNYHDTKYAYTKTKKDLSDIYENITSLGKNIPFDENLFNSDEFVNANFYDPDISIIRTGMINLLKHYNVIVKVNGTLDRKPGQVIEIDYPKINNDDDVQYSFDGNWFLMNIHHIINNDGEYEHNLLLSKNAKFDFSGLKLVNGSKNT